MIIYRATNIDSILFCKQKEFFSLQCARLFNKAVLLMANTITKRELVNKVCAELDNGFTQNEVLDIIQKTIELITEALGNGDRVVLRNFGTFTVKEVKPKVGRNPKDPAKNVPIPARSVVKFKVGKNLKEAAAKVS